MKMSGLLYSNALKFMLCSALLLLVPATAMAGDIYLHMLIPDANVSGPRYLGDTFNDGSTWYLKFEVGQESWNKSEAGIGPSNSDPDDLEWNWADSTWYENGEYPNKRVQRNIGSVRLTSVGTWYFCGRAKGESVDNWHYANNTTWGNSSTFNPAYTFTVSALVSPSVTSVTPNGSTEVDLEWSRGVSGSTARDTIIFRSTSSTAPALVGGTGYSSGSNYDFGGNTYRCIYKGSGTTASDSGLSADTQYYYYFFAENYSYYSSSANGSTTTSSGVDVRAFQTSDGVVVEFVAYDVEADGSIQLALMGVDESVLWSESVAVVPAAQAFARFLVPGLELGGAYDFKVRDEVGKWWDASGVTVQPFAAEMVSASLAGITLSFDSLPGHTYEIQWCPALGSAWQKVDEVTAVTSKTEVVVPHPDPENVSCFFRFVLK